MNWTAADHAFMARALVLAREGLHTTTPNPRVGCVLVRDGKVVGEGWHAQAGGPHAEIVALAMAGDRARGATCYVSLEPCSHHGRTPPCTDALITAGVARVVAAMQDPNPRVAGRGLAALAAAGIDARAGLLTQDAHRLNAGFCRRMSGRGPWVTAKLAISLDGRTAAADGNARWITGEAARADVQLLRARSCAVLTGSGTILDDDPRLDVRLAEARQPLRVLLDRRLRCPEQARILGVPGRVVIFTAPGADGTPRGTALARAGARLVTLDGPGDQFARAALQWLSAEHEINEVLVEAGPLLTGALVSAGLVDEIIVYQAPLLLGNRGRAMLDLPGIGTMASAVGLQRVDTRFVGADLRSTFQFRES